MTTAFLDTTVVVDSTLKGRSIRKATEEAVGRFSERLLPAYAIKEFKAGALQYFAWFHNRLAQSANIAEAIGYIQAISRGPQRYRTATALTALQGVVAEFQNITNGDLVQKYGKRASVDESLRDLMRLNVKQLIYRAWKRRRQIATQVVEPMACYEESGPWEKRGQIQLAPRGCPQGATCGLSERVKADAALLARLHEVSKGEATGKRENTKRAAALRNLVRKPKERLTPDACRALGDAMFVILAPKDATIVTTNLGDYEPLANAAGKRAELP